MSNDDLLINSFCLYFDLLGFNQYLQGATREKRTADLKHYQKLVDNIYEYLESSRSPSWVDKYEYKIFSDNIVIRIKIGEIELHQPNDGESEFGALMHDIQMIILKIIEFGFFVRGSLTLGELFLDESIIYGTALSEAYLLESKSAIYPRIILSEDVKKLVYEHTKYYNPKYDSPQNRDLLIDADGKMFVNYLEMVRVTKLVSFFKTHKEKIEKNLSETKEVRIKEKYEWLINYHNFCCDKFPGCSIFRINAGINLAIGGPRFLFERL